jgi:exonuclease SbcC
VETKQDLFKQLETIENLFSEGLIKKAQKNLRDTLSILKNEKKVPNKLRHKVNFVVAQSRYFDDMSSFAANPKREALIKEISALVESNHENPKSQANAIHDIQKKWQQLDTSSRPASKDQWIKFNELTNKAWEPCKEFFDELNKVKEQNAQNRYQIINEINSYVENNSTKWPDAKTLIFYLRDKFNEWQEHAPVLDKDLKKLRNDFFNAKKPINDQIKKQEKAVIKIKEDLIAKVDLINDEENDVCIKKFNELKNDWKKSGSAGRKIDNKLWDKFNKSADRFFTAKKEVIDEEIKTANDLLEKLKKNEISVVDVENNIKELTNISKSKELNALRNEIKAQNNALQLEKKKNKLDGYKELFNAYANNKLDDEKLPSQIVSKIKDLNVKKSDSEQVTYSCIKLEIMAGIESLKKDSEVRNKIQLEMLTEKFNSTGANLNTLDSLLIHFFSHLSSKPTAAEKTLWKRISNSIENLV